LFINAVTMPRYWIAQRGVEYRPQPGIDSAFHLQKEHRRVAHQV
jgi:hypothetical protein